MQQATKGGMSTDRNRSIFKHVKSLFPGKDVQPGFLRSEIELVNGQTQYIFEFQKDSNAQVGKLEEKINTKDAFSISHIEYGLMADDLTAPGTNDVYNYVNPYEHNLAGVVLKHLNSFFNGKMNLIVDQTVKITSLDTRRFRTVGGLIQTDTKTTPEFSWEQNGKEITPVITMFGSATNTLSVTIAPVAGQAVQTNGGAAASGVQSGDKRVMKLVAILYGYYIPDGAKK